MGTSTLALPPEWARYELQMAISDGLFHPKKRQDLNPRMTVLQRVDFNFDIKRQGRVYPDGIHLELHVPVQLDTTAETLLLSMLYLAGQQGHGLWIAPDSWAMSSPLLLEPKGHANQERIGVLETSRYQLLKTAGMGHSTFQYRQMKRYLQLLSMISVFYENHVDGWSGSDWLFKYAMEPRTDRLIVQFNWRLAGAVFGDYLRAYIDLNERKQLKQDPAKTCHRFLSAYVWPGKTRLIAYERLADHVWPSEEQVTSNTRRQHVYRLKKEILPAVAALPAWTITQNTRHVEISRANCDDN